MNSLPVNVKNQRFARARRRAASLPIGVISLMAWAVCLFPSWMPAQEEDAVKTDFPPKKFEPRRYEAIAQKNPFVREIQAVQGEEVVDDWAKELTVRGYSKLDGKYVVHLENKKLRSEKDFRLRRHRFMRLIEGEPLDVSGWGGPSKLTLVGVVPSRDPKRVEVRIEGDIGAGQGKAATIKYDEGDLKGNASTRLPAAAPGPDAAGAVGAPPGAATPPRVEGRGGRRDGDQGRRGGNRGGQQGGGGEGQEGGAEQAQPTRRVVLPPGIPRPEEG